MSKFHLQIVTPDKLFIDEEVDAVTVRTTEGEMTLLGDHIDFVSTLQVYVAQIKQNGKTRKATLAGGILENDNNKVTIISLAAEWTDQIDISRAEKSKAEAENKMQQSRDSMHEMQIAEFKLKKAINRINAVK